MQIKLKQRDILFAFHPGKQSFLGIDYCLLVARNYVYISAKNVDPFCFTSYLKVLKNKKSPGQTKIRFETLLLFKALLCCSILVSVCKTVIRRFFQLAILTSCNFFL